MAESKEKKPLRGGALPRGVSARVGVGVFVLVVAAFVFVGREAHTSSRDVVYDPAVLSYSSAINDDDGGPVGFIQSSGGSHHLRGRSRSPLAMAAAAPDMDFAAESISAMDFAEESIEGDAPSADEASAMMMSKRVTAGAAAPRSGRAAGAYSTSAQLKNGVSTSASSTPASPVPDDAKMLRRRADVEVVTKSDKVFAVAEAAEALVVKHGGFSERSDRRNGRIDRFGRRRDRQATATLRVPVEEYAAVVANLVGGLDNLITPEEVASAAEAVEDVTAEYLDVTARVKTLEASRTQLYEVLSTATAIQDVLAVRNQISQVTQDLEGRQARASYLAKEAALSTISLRVTQKEDAPPPPPPPPKPPSLWHRLVLKTGLTWPKFVARRVARAAEISVVVAGAVLKTAIAIAIYGLFALPLALLFAYLAPYFLKLLASLYERCATAVQAALRPAGAATTSSKSSAGGLRPSSA